jgi:hypothetical protein
MEACVPAVGGFSLDKRAGVPERAKASVLSRPRTPTVAEYIFQRFIVKRPFDCEA